MKQKYLTIAALVLLPLLGACDGDNDSSRSQVVNDNNGSTTSTNANIVYQKCIKACQNQDELCVYDYESDTPDCEAQCDNDMALYSICGDIYERYVDCNGKVLVCTDDDGVTGRPRGCSKEFKEMTSCISDAYRDSLQ